MEFGSRGSHVAGLNVHSAEVPLNGLAVRDRLKRWKIAIARNMCTTVQVITSFLKMS